MQDNGAGEVKKFIDTPEDFLQAGWSEAKIKDLGTTLTYRTVLTPAFLVLPRMDWNMVIILFKKRIVVKLTFSP